MSAERGTVLKVYNTLSRSLDEVKPVESGVVRMYTCGPTVYRDAHIGNLRSYLMADWIRRILTAQGMDVVHIKNITDVGHMRQEMLERGEDKIIAAAIEEGKSPAEIAQFYTDRFLKDEKKLRIRPAHEFPKATDHISEMIEIVEKLVEKGYAYESEGNVYFEVSKFPGYGQLSGNIHEAELLEAVRVDADPLKRDPRDFTLWKAAEPGRMVKWDSPWGEGFPGWHIECSAMSIKYLGTQVRHSHRRRRQHLPPPRRRDRAERGIYRSSPWSPHGSTASTCSPTASRWRSPPATHSSCQTSRRRASTQWLFRYLCMTARFNTRLNFTFTSLRAAQRGLQRLKNRIWRWTIEAEEAPDTAQSNGAEIEEWTRGSSKP